MSTELREGAVFAQRYQVVRRIATGGMGAVYEVVHLETERRRALKVMHAHILQNDDLRERFKREAKVAAHIESEFIVDVFDAGVDEETKMPFLVMELLRGEELGKRLRRLGRLPPSEVVTYMRHLAMALEKIHRASIVHRDIKPENIFLTLLRQTSFAELRSPLRGAAALAFVSPGTSPGPHDATRRSALPRQVCRSSANRAGGRAAQDQGPRLRDREGRG